MSTVPTAVRCLAAIGVAGVLAGLVGCSSDDGLTGSGEYEKSPEKISELVASAETGQGRVYCESDTGSVRLASWLRGPDDFVLVADEKLGLARDSEAVMFWDREQGLALEVLNEEMGLMGLDLDGVSSETVFGNFAAGAGGEEGTGTRCRPLSETVYPDLEGLTVYTMLDVESGKMAESDMEALFASFAEF